MSEKATFSTGYIFHPEDFHTIMTRAEELGNSKYFNFSSPPKWISESDVVYEEHVLQGTVIDFAQGLEYMGLSDNFEGITTHDDITFAVISECGNITEVLKKADGRIEVYDLSRHIPIDYTPGIPKLISYLLERGFTQQQNFAHPLTFEKRQDQDKIVVQFQTDIHGVYVENAMFTTKYTCEPFLSVDDLADSIAAVILRHSKKCIHIGTTKP